MENIYNSIKEDIRCHDAVTYSVLGQVDHWKRSQFVILSQIITTFLSKSEQLHGDKKFDLGLTISHITLQRFFENNYQEKTHNDLRFLKTLDKICIFLGYHDLNSYIRHKNWNQTPIKTEGIPDPFYMQMINGFCKAQFDCAKKLPESDATEILNFVFEKSPLFERIQNFFQEQKTKNLKLVTKNNRSNFEVFNFVLVSEQDEVKVIKTEEFWNLLFKEIGTEHKYSINRLNTQTYFIKKIKGEWKIWDNHNPDSGKVIKL